MKGFTPTGLTIAVQGPSVGKGFNSTGPYHSG